MTYKQIEASREVQLWVGHIVVPAISIAVTAMSIPEVRQATSAKFQSIKNFITQNKNES